jgi:hypothetical protein
VLIGHDGPTANRAPQRACKALTAPGELISNCAMHYLIDIASSFSQNAALAEWTSCLLLECASSGPQASLPRKLLTLNCSLLP